MVRVTYVAIGVLFCVLLGGIHAKCEDGYGADIEDDIEEPDMPEDDEYDGYQPEHSVAHTHSKPAPDAKPDTKPKQAAPETHGSKPEKVVSGDVVGGSSGGKAVSHGGLSIGARSLRERRYIKYARKM